MYYTKSPKQRRLQARRPPSPSGSSSGAALRFFFFEGGDSGTPSPRRAPKGLMTPSRTSWSCNARLAGVRAEARIHGAASR